MPKMLPVLVIRVTVFGIVRKIRTTETPSR